MGGVLGGWAYCNGWNGINGTVLITWKPHVGLSSIDSSYSTSHQPPLNCIVKEELAITVYTCCILLYPAVSCCILLYTAASCCILLYPAASCST